MKECKCDNLENGDIIHVDKDGRCIVCGTGHPRMTTPLKTQCCCEKCYTSDYVEGQVVAIGCLNDECICHQKSVVESWKGDELTNKLQKEAREKFRTEFWKLSGESAGELDRKQDQFVDTLIETAVLEARRGLGQSIYNALPTIKQINTQSESGGYGSGCEFAYQCGAKDLQSIVINHLAVEDAFTPPLTTKKEGNQISL